MTGEWRLKYRPQTTDHYELMHTFHTDSLTPQGKTSGTGVIKLPCIVFGEVEKTHQYPFESPTGSH